MMEESMKLSNELLDFIQKSPSCYHAVENLAQTLCDTGFLELSEGALWRLQRGGRYFIRRTTILPATDNGRSNQGAQSIPPYFSTFSSV